jgi:hypothetical protein
MGLDMFMFRSVRRDDGGWQAKGKKELAYWRKHPNLHGYIVDEYAGGVDECQEIPLDVKALDDIIEAVREERLPPTTGFFFGTSRDDEEQRKMDVEALTLCKEWIEGGPEGERRVIYQASW